MHFNVCLISRNQGWRVTLVWALWGVRGQAGGEEWNSKATCWIPWTYVHHEEGLKGIIWFKKKNKYYVVRIKTDFILLGNLLTRTFWSWLFFLVTCHTLICPFFLYLIKFVLITMGFKVSYVFLMYNMQNGLQFHHVNDSNNKKIEDTSFCSFFFSCQIQLNNDALPVT